MRIQALPLLVEQTHRNRTVVFHALTILTGSMPWAARVSNLVAEMTVANSRVAYSKLAKALPGSPLFLPACFLLRFR